MFLRLTALQQSETGAKEMEERPLIVNISDIRCLTLDEDEYTIVRLRDGTEYTVDEAFSAIESALKTVHVTPQQASVSTEDNEMAQQQRIFNLRAGGIGGESAGLGWHWEMDGTDSAGRAVRICYATNREFEGLFVWLPNRQNWHQLAGTSQFSLVPNRQIALRQIRGNELLELPYLNSLWV